MIDEAVLDFAPGSLMHDGALGHEASSKKRRGPTRC